MKLPYKLVEKHQQEITRESLPDTIRDLESRSQESIKYANRIDIHNEMQNHNVDRAKVDNMIEKMVRDGTLMLPRGYDTIQTLR